MSRPEISFYTCQLSTRVKDATVSDLLAAKKVIKFLKDNPGFLKFQSMDLSSLSVFSYADASWNNLPNAGRQAGQLVFFKDKNNAVAPIIWSSTRIKRVARSTLAAEFMTMLECADSSFYISQLLSAVLK